MDQKLDQVEQRIAVLTEKYLELQSKVSTGADKTESDTKDAEIEKLKKENAKLAYRVDFLVREMIQDREKIKAAAKQ